MALKEYDVVIDGHRTTVQLSDEDARTQGLVKPDSDPTVPRAELEEAIARAKAAEDREKDTMAKLQHAEEQLTAARAAAAAKQAAAPKNKAAAAPTQKDDGSTVNG